MWQFLLLAVLLAGAAEAAPIAMPDPTLTPGTTLSTSARALCATKWGKDVRHVTLTMKRAVCAAYGAHACPGPRWEIDHLVSRELLGADVVANLWPQPIAQARLKDRLENALHRDVCAGRLSLERAQHLIRTDWHAEWARRFAP